MNMKERYEMIKRKLESDYLNDYVLVALSTLVGGLLLIGIVIEIVRIITGTNNHLR